MFHPSCSRLPVLASIAALSTVAATPATARPRFAATYEAGPGYVLQNDNRYGDAGTPYEAADVGQQANLARLERTTVSMALGRHRLIALYAPLQLSTRVALASDLRFRDTLFLGGTVVDHLYRFDGLRASYLYALREGDLSVEVGASLQVRDADVAFTSVDGRQRANQTDIGLVPALKARATWAPDRTWAMLEVDASSTFGLVGDTSGGLYDVALACGYPVRRDVDVYANLRLLGGGAEVPAQAIDNWANFVSAAIGVRLTLRP